MSKAKQGVRGSIYKFKRGIGRYFI